MKIFSLFKLQFVIDFIITYNVFNLTFFVYNYFNYNLFIQNCILNYEHQKITDAVKLINDNLISLINNK